MATRKKTASTSAKTTSRKRATKAKAPVPEPKVEDVVAPTLEADLAAETEALYAPEDVSEGDSGAPVVETPATPVPTKLVKKDLVDRVIARSGVKPRFVRQVTEALLFELGAMIEDADTVQLQPLGNVKVQRRKEIEGAEIVVLKVRRKKDDPGGNDPLAAAAE